MDHLLITDSRNPNNVKASSPVMEAPAAAAEEGFNLTEHSARAYEVRDQHGHIVTWPDGTPQWQAYVYHKYAPHAKIDPDRPIWMTTTLPHKHKTKEAALAHAQCHADCLNAVHRLLIS